MLGSLKLQNFLFPADVAEHRFDPWHGIVNARRVTIEGRQAAAAHFVDHGVELMLFVVQ